MEYIGPQVWPGGWKVVSREEADLLTSLGVDVRAWYLCLEPNGALEDWWTGEDPCDEPWEADEDDEDGSFGDVYFGCTQVYFVRDADGQT